MRKYLDIYTLIILIVLTLMVIFVVVKVSAQEKILSEISIQLQELELVK